MHFSLLKMNAFSCNTSERKLQIEHPCEKPHRTFEDLQGLSKPCQLHAFKFHLS